MAERNKVRVIVWLAAWLVAAAPGLARAETDVDPRAPAPGFLVAVGAGGALLAPTSLTPGITHLALGFRAGARFRNGLACAFSYDDLGLQPRGAGTPWQLLSVEARYAFFQLAPTPYAEGLAGFTFLSSDAPLHPGGGKLEVDATAGLGAGIQLELRRDLQLELGGRVFAAPALGTGLVVFTLNVGVELDFLQP